MRDYFTTLHYCYTTALWQYWIKGVTYLLTYLAAKFMDKKDIHMLSTMYAVVPLRPWRNQIECSHITIIWEELISATSSWSRTTLHANHCMVQEVSHISFPACVGECLCIVLVVSCPESKTYIAGVWTWCNCRLTFWWGWCGPRRYYMWGSDSNVWPAFSRKTYSYCF